MNLRFSVWIAAILTAAAGLLYLHSLVKESTRSDSRSKQEVVNSDSGELMESTVRRSSNPEVTSARIERFFDRVDERAKDSIERLRSRSRESSSFDLGHKRELGSPGPSSDKPGGENEDKTAELRRTLREAARNESLQIGDEAGAELVRWIREIDKYTDSGRLPSEPGLFLDLLSLFDRVANDLKVKEAISATEFQRMVYRAVQLREGGAKVKIGRPLTQRIAGKAN